MKKSVPDRSCACKGKNLEKFIQPIIFSILSNGSSNGYRIRAEIGRYATFNTDPDPAGVYRYLHTMCSKDYLIQDDNGEYSITETGRKCFQNWKRTLHDYIQKLSLLEQEL